MTATSTLAVRRRGSNTWVELDLDSILARHSPGLSHPVEDIMTAATLHVVPDETMERYGLLLKARRKAREAYDFARTLPRNAWDWAYETFRLDAVAALGKDIYRWISSKAAAAGRLIGVSGGTGLGLLGIATRTGRDILKATLGRLLFGAYALLEWTYDTSTSLLRRLGGPGNWVADRIDNVAVLLKTGAAKGLEFYAANLGKYFALDSKTMATARVAGAWLVALRALSFINTPFISLPVMAGLAIYTLLSEPASSVPGLREAGDWLRGESKTTQRHMKAVDHELDEAVTAAAQATATGHDVPTPSAAAPNRASQRASDRAKKRATAGR